MKLKIFFWGTKLAKLLSFQDGILLYSAKERKPSATSSYMKLGVCDCTNPLCIHVLMKLYSFAFVYLTSSGTYIAAG